MPTYAYLCAACSADFDVVKRMAELDRAEACPACSHENGPRSRQMQRTNFSGASDWNTQTWNPGLGCYTKSNKHAAQIAKSKGMIEIGNEKPETVHAHFDRQREDTREQRWREAERDKVYD